MILNTEDQNLFKIEDLQIYKRQLKFLSKGFNQHLSSTLYLLYYILLVYDESIICFAVRCLLHLLLTHMIDELINDPQSISGVSRAEALTRLSNRAPDTPGTGRTAGNTGDDDTNDGVIGSDVDQFFSKLTGVEKKATLQRLFMVFLFTWTVSLIYQVLFCLGNTFDGTINTIFGNLNPIIQESAYSSVHLQDGNQWTIESAFTMGGFSTSWIGESKFRSSMWKFATILVIDFLVITLQFISIAHNYGLGFHIIERFENNDEIDEDERREMILNNMHGKLPIFELNPVTAITEIVTLSRSTST